MLTIIPIYVIGALLTGAFIIYNKSTFDDAPVKLTYREQNVMMVSMVLLWFVFVAMLIGIFVWIIINPED